MTRTNEESTRRAATPTADAAIRVLLVSDLPNMILGLRKLLERGPGMVLIGTASLIEEAQCLLKDHSADIVLFHLAQSSSRGIVELLNGGRTRVIALTASRDSAFCDAAVLAGASGVLNVRDVPRALLKAVERVHAGEFWLDRAAAGRVFVAMARQRLAGNSEQKKIAAASP